MATATENTLRKAAVLVRSLDEGAATALLSRLSANEARSLRAAIRELSPVGDEERERVAEEVRQANARTAPSARSPTPAGVELALGTSLGRPEDASQPNTDPTAWLRSLSNADPRAIAAYLSREQPRAVAVVLSHLPASLSAGVLAEFPAEERCRVVAQLATIGDADPDSLRVIASGLADWIGQQEAESRRRSDRLATIREILLATPTGERGRLLQSLEDSEPQLAAELRVVAPRPIESPAPTDAHVEREEAAAGFRPLPPEELERLDGRTLAEAVSALDGQTALLALAASPASVLERLCGGLPKATASDLRQRVNRVGPATLPNIERARLELARAASDALRAKAARPHDFEGAN